MVAPPYYKHYPRSVSWQVASVLNPSLHNSLPSSQLSTHSRVKQEREGGLADQTGSKPEGKPQSAVAAYKSWQEEDEEGGHKLTLPPQYVCPGELCKAMPKYIRLKVRPNTNGNGQPVPFSTATSTEPVNPYSPGLSLGYNLAAGSPRSQDSSGRETPRSALDFPQNNTSTTCKAPQQAKSTNGTGAASPALPARSLKQTPLVTAKSSYETTPPVNAGFQNTPLSTSELRRLKTGPPSGAPSPSDFANAADPSSGVQSDGRDAGECDGVAGEAEQVGGVPRADAEDGADGVHSAGESVEPRELSGGLAVAEANFHPACDIASDASHRVAPRVGATGQAAQPSPAGAHSGDVQESLLQHARHQHRVERPPRHLSRANQSSPLHPHQEYLIPSL